MSDLAIIGTGGFARGVEQVVLDINAEARTWNLLGFLDDDESLHGRAVHGLPVLGGVEWLRANPEVQTVVAIGGPALRRRIVLRYESTGVARFATLVHPRAWVGRQVTIGCVSTVCAGVAITTDVAIGAHVIVNVNCTIGHDVRLGDCVTLAPGVHISGNVVLGEGADLGTGSVVIQNRSVGAWTMIGAGAVVVRDIGRDATAEGMPVREIKTRSAGWQDIRPDGAPKAREASDASNAELGARDGVLRSVPKARPHQT